MMLTDVVLKMSFSAVGPHLEKLAQCKAFLLVIYCSYIKQNTTVVTSFPCDSLLNSLSPQIRLSNMLKIIIMVRHMATQGYNCVFFSIRIKSWVCQPQSRDFLILPRTGRCILHDGAAGTTPADVAKLNQGPFNSREGFPVTSTSFWCVSQFSLDWWAVQQDRSVFYSFSLLIPADR